jgi:hypothetical protein
VNELLAQLNAVWNQILEITAAFVIPDWGALIALLPVFVFVFVIGPAVTLAVLAWFVYVVRKPRAKVTIEEGVRRATRGADGSPEYPRGLPYCLRDGIVYASGATRCAECRDGLTVTCPMCGLGRDAAITTCGNCGLVLKIESRTQVMRPAGPPPGGAAVA